MRTLIIGLVLGAAAAAVAAPVGAQTVDANGRAVYEAAFFTQFAPSNAFQIVERVPGFSLEDPVQDSDVVVRGFSGAAGNVVINGQRPSSKSDSLETILARIPASRVARVEIGSGTLFGADYAGKAQVVNLVLTAGGGLAGTINASVIREYTGELFPEGSVAALIRRGNSTFNLSLGINNSRIGDEGTDTLRAVLGGQVVEFRRKVNDYNDPNTFVTAGWEYNGGTNRTAHLNGRWAVDRFRLVQNNDVFPTGGVVRNDLLSQSSDRTDFEIGGDVTRPLWGGGIKLIGLATRRDRENLDENFNRVRSVIVGGATQLLNDQRDERVARLVWNRSGWGGWNVELGAEGVLNRLDSRVDLIGIGAGGVRARIDLPVDQAVVEEYRGEAFANAGRDLSSELRLDLGLNYEASRLTVRGDATAERTLKFWKPKVALDWRPAEGWRVQAVAKRTVAQLQFEDFISAAEFSNDRVNGGNANLLPQRAWESLVTVEHRILKDGLIKLEGGYNRIALVQDRVPTPEGFDAPGNLGNGREIIARATLDAPLSDFGIKGGRASGKFSWVDTSVIDPYTLRARRFSFNTGWTAEASFRQDVGKFAYGFTGFWNSGDQTAYRRNELDRFFNDGVYVNAFAEYRPTPQTTVRLGLNNALNTVGGRERTFFVPDRRTPNPSIVEYRERNNHLQPSLGIKHNFG